ncbi:MAG: tetratricopeptide repeat protein [Bacteroidota bacterium]
MKGKILIIGIVFFACSSGNLVFPNEEQVDSAILKYQKTDKPLVKLNLLLDEIIPHYMQNNPDSALYFGLQGKNIADYAIAGSDSQDTINLFKQRKTRILRFLGNVHLARGQNETAIKYFHESLEISESLEDKDGIARDYVNIGNVLMSEKMFAEALGFFEQSYITGSELNDLKIMSASSNNMGNVYREQGKSQEALHHYFRSLELKEEMGDRRGMVNTFNNIGLVYKNERQYDKAIENYLKSFEIAEEVNNRFGMAMVLGNLSNVYLAMAEEEGLSATGRNSRQALLRQAVNYGLRAMEVARSVKALPRVNYASKFLMKAYRELGLHRQALEYAEIYIETRDSLFNEEKTAIIAELQTRFESEQRLQEISNQQLIIEKQQVENQRQRLQSNLLLVIIFFLIFTAILLLMQYRQKAKNHKVINEKNSMLERAYEELQSINEELVVQQEIIKENLEKKIAVAEQMLDFKQKFLAQMSHEIRTPLTGVLGITDALEKTPLNEEQSHYLDILKYSGESLIGIINDVLDYSKIEAGKLELKKSVFNLADMLSASINLFAGTNRNEVKLEMELSDNLPGYVEADELRIGQVIRNFLSNAIKFTEKGKIVLGAEVVEPANQGQQVLIRIWVKDTGAGIPTSQIDQLFKPFSQLRRSDLRPAEGTGLGLSICKEIVVMHGGEIGVNSTPGEGSEFWFTVSMKIPEKGDQPSSVKQPREFSLPTRLAILLVEDKEVNKKVMKLLLSGLGHEVTVAAHGKEAVELFQPGKFDLILMDIEMPVMDGVTATAHLRENYSNLPPIIGLSANALEGDREKYMLAGMDEYLTKPFNVDAFLRVVEKVIRVK